MKRSTRRRALIVVVTLAALGVSFAALRSVSTRGRARRGQDPGVVTFPPGARATVLHVVDGDTAYFTLERGGWVKGRLAGINTPECHKEQVRLAGGRRSARCARDDELWGVKAHRALLALLKRGPLTLDCQRKRDGSCQRDRHGRVLITIRAGGQDVAEQLARAGAAWSFTKYPSPHRARLCRAELAARAARAGMWAEGSVAEVLAMMSPRTRSWYADHDRRCAAAAAGGRRTRAPNR